jgi:hypothetical protein
MWWVDWHHFTRLATMCSWRELADRITELGSRQESQDGNNKTYPLTLHTIHPFVPIICNIKLSYQTEYFSCSINRMEPSAVGEKHSLHLNPPPLSDEAVGTPRRRCPVFIACIRDDLFSADSNDDTENCVRPAFTYSCQIAFRTL